MIGQPTEAAMWYKTADQREKAKDYIREAFKYDEAEHGLIFGEIEFYDADLNNRRSPAPPESGAQLLVGEAIIVGLRPSRGEDFLLDLDTKDLDLLRRITQEAWTKGGYKPLSVDELDKTIARTAPEVMDKMLRWGHEHGIDRTH